MDVKKAAAETKDYIVSIRREFHRHPELSLQEFRTAQRIEEELDKFGIPHTRVGETGVLGTLRGAKDNGKVLVLRADIDALPIEETHECVYRSENAGVMHACGHDAHAACLLGAAKILSENRDAFSGKVRLVFQPGEEIGKGAKPFVAAGVLDGAERVFEGEPIHRQQPLPKCCGIEVGQRACDTLEYDLSSTIKYPVKE